MNSQRPPPSPVGYAAYCEVMLFQDDIETPVDVLEERALRAALAAEQQDYQDRCRWIFDKMAEIVSRRPPPPARLTPAGFAWPEPPRDTRATIADWMIANGYPTGHGDTAEDLLRELAAEATRRERARCQAIAGKRYASCTASPDWRQCAASIVDEIEGEL